MICLHVYMKVLKDLSLMPKVQIIEVRKRLPGVKTSCGKTK